MTAIAKPKAQVAPEAPLCQTIELDKFRNSIIFALTYPTPNTIRTFWEDVFYLSGATLTEDQKPHLHQWILDNKFYITEQMSKREKITFSHKLRELVPHQN